MIVGILTISLSIPGSDSLKDKRQVVKSVLDQIRAKFNVSAAEVDSLDSHTRAGLAFTCVSNSSVLVDQMLNKVTSLINSNPRCEITDSSLEFV